jgi:hypothetical protein
LLPPEKFGDVSGVLIWVVPPVPASDAFPSWTSWQVLLPETDVGPRSRSTYGRKSSFSDQSAKVIFAIACLLRRIGDRDQPVFPLAKLFFHLSRETPTCCRSL